MNKIILSICFMIGLTVFAQPNTGKNVDPKTTFSFTYDQSQAHNYLFTVEAAQGKNSMDFNYSAVFQIGYAHMDQTVHDNYVKGDGVFISFGAKMYLDEFMDSGWNVQNAIELSHYNFNDKYMVPGSNTVYAGFTNFSFINPIVAYKFMVGKMAIEPFVGGSWSFIFSKNSYGNQNNFGYLTPKFGVRIGFLNK